MNATWDQDTNAYHFGPTDQCVANVIELGNRHVELTVDFNGHIIGVDVT